MNSESMQNAICMHRIRLFFHFRNILRPRRVCLHVKNEKKYLLGFYTLNIKAHMSHKIHHKLMEIQISKNQNIKIIDK